MYSVYKIFPSSCPKCNNSFSSQSNFGIFHGKGNSLLEAMKYYHKKSPDLYFKYDIDHIMCNDCENVTMRINYLKRQVETLEEANNLIEMKGYTGWVEVKATGNMAKPVEYLSMLAKTELENLSREINDARNLASLEDDVVKGNEIFFNYFEPSLANIVEIYQQDLTSHIIRDKLKDYFGDYWEIISLDSRDFLITAEILKDVLTQWSKKEPSIDFTPVVSMYSKALENEITEKIFIEFKKSNYSHMFPNPTGKKSFDKNLEYLKLYTNNKRKLTLGEMAFCLQHIGCKLRNYDNNGFSHFLNNLFASQTIFCDVNKLPSRIMKYTAEYRNRAAHVSRVTLEECLSARKFLLDEPIRLLVLLFESLKTV